METSAATTTRHSDFQLTIIDSGLLVERLGKEIRSLTGDLRRSWPTFKKDPWGVSSRTLHSVLSRIRQNLRSPSRLISYVSSCLLIASLVAFVSLIDASRKSSGTNPTVESFIGAQSVQLIKVSDVVDGGTGKNGDGSVGFRVGKGEGSGVAQRAQGGGSGGNKTPKDPQQGKLFQRSTIQAAITEHLSLSPSLPVAGMDIDQALWNDSKSPQYGDPNSKSQVVSHGPGDGGGIGTNQGLGIGDGRGPGYGTGEDGNMGGGRAQKGCCGDGGSRNNSNGPAAIFRSVEVEHRARLLSKPEPQYTEEARRNQVSGTVTLRCVFSSDGDVIQIHTIQTLPFGLTERAIAAARQIRFIPATKNGHSVSVWMQLEYNFNLY